MFVASDHDHMLGVFRAKLGGEGVTFHRLGREVRDINEISSVSIRSIRKFIITEKAPTRAFSWLKAATTAFTFKTLLRHYGKLALTPRFLNVKLGPRRKS